jgi:TolB protein
VIANLMSLPISPNSSEAAGPPTSLTENTSYRKSLPVFSHDGRKIAFVEFRGGEHAKTWAMDSDGRNVTQLTTGSAADWAPSWFPDNDTIAFQSNREGKQRTWSISVSTGRERLLVDPGQAIGWPRLSPDGKQIAFNSTKSGTLNVWLVSVEGGTPRQLTVDKEAMGWPSWSPDGKLLALQIKRGEDTNIGIMPSTGGEITQLTFEHGESRITDWSPDGDKLIFAGERNGIWNVYWFSRATKQQKQLTHYTKLNEYVAYPAWSPVGNQIVYEYGETSGNIWLMELK